VNGLETKMADLAARLPQAADPGSMVVNLTADRNIDFSAVDRVLAECRNAGAYHVVLETLEKDE
jgi:biopolymer transport protein ExbD